MMRVLFTMFFVLAPVLAYGTTYYVGKTGKDFISCSLAQSLFTPKLTIAAGLACLSGGDTLVIKAGTYAEYIEYNQIPAGLSTTSRTTVMATPGEIVILRPTTGTPSEGSAIRIYRSFITLDGFVLDSTNPPIMGIRINNGASYIRIQNMEVKNASHECIGINNDRTSNVEIIKSKLHDCGFKESGGRQHGIYLRGSNHLVERNEIYNIASHGVHLWNSHGPSNNNNIVRYNYIHNNGSRGILVGSGNGNQAYGNIVGNNGTSGIHVGFNTTNNNQVYNNTIYSNGDCIVIRSGSTNSRVNNNICWQNRRDAVIDHGSGSIIINTRVINPFIDVNGASISLSPPINLEATEPK